jgi:hypothetical protein
MIRVVIILALCLIAGSARANDSETDADSAFAICRKYQSCIRFNSFPDIGCLLGPYPDEIQDACKVLEEWDRQRENVKRQRDFDFVRGVAGKKL